MFACLGIVFLGIIATGWWWLTDTEEAANRYEFAAVTRGDIEEVVTAQGKLEPKEFVDVGAQVTGQLLHLYVEIGDVVKKGELIAEIDPRIYTARVEADEARLKTLRAQLDEQLAQIAFTKAVYQRNQTLIKQDAISTEALQASEKEYKAAEARAASFRAQIEEAESTLAGDKANLSFSKIYAPMDGTVVSQTAKEGQTLNANQTAPILVQIANLDVMTVRAQIAEADVARITPEMEVYFTTLGAERRWQGEVRQLLPSPDATVLDVILYNALVDVQNQDRKLMTGMSTQMFFVLGRAENTLLIPVKALGKPLPEQDTEQGKAYEIQLRKEGRVVTGQVIVGLMNRSNAEVKSGLQEGDEVAIPASEAKNMNQPRFGPRI